MFSALCIIIYYENRTQGTLKTLKLKQYTVSVLGLIY